MLFHNWEGDHFNVLCIAERKDDDDPEQSMKESKLERVGVIFNIFGGNGW